MLQADEGGSRIQLAQQLEQPGPIDMGTAMWKLYLNTDDCYALYERCLAVTPDKVRSSAQNPSQTGGEILKN